MTLNITLKNALPEPFAQVMRQIEFWANAEHLSGAVTALTLKPSFGLLAGSGVPSWAINPFDEIRLLGTTAYSGSMVAGTSYTISALPPNLAPRVQRSFPTVLNLISSTANTTGNIQILANGNLNVVPFANISNPLVLLDGITYLAWTL